MKQLRYILMVALLVCATVTTAHATTWPNPVETSGWHGYGWFAENGWTVPADELPARMVLLGEPPAGVSLEQVESAARNAVASWSGVPCSSARMVYAGQRAGLDELGPDEIPLVFTSPDQADCFLQGALAFTKLGCVDDYPNRTVFLNSGDFDWSIEPKPFQPAYTDPAGDHRLIADVESVLTHEFGHVLGLSHSADTLATMYASYRGDGGQRSLAVDDKLGVCALYQVANPPDECSSGRDCPSRESCERVEGIEMCRELRGEVGDPCALDRLVCTDTCVLADEPDAYGYCTTSCGGDDRVCPQGFRCTEGFLTEGESHCERTSKPDEPACNSSGGPWPSPTPLTAVLFVVGVALMRRGLSRARGSR